MLGAVTATTMAVPGGVVVLCSAVLLPSTLAAAVTMLLLGVPLSARIIRAAAGTLKNAEFLHAAERRGENVWYLVFGELIPALSGTVIADAAVRILVSLQLLSTLHVLGFGPSPPATDWAIMIRENLPGVMLAPWSVAAPAIALTLVSIAVTLCLDALSHALAPTSTSRRVTRRSSPSATGDQYEAGLVLDVAELHIGSARAPLLSVDELQLAPGEIVGLRGPSGTGKSTLLDTLIGVPRSGLHVSATRLKVLGCQLPTGDRRLAKWRHRTIGWSEQDPRRTLDGRHSVAEVIADGRRHTRPAKELLQLVGLPAEFETRAVATLSGGQAARVSLARALAPYPRLLILDEPTAGLDSASADMVRTTIRRFAEGGGGVLIVSHDRSWLDQAADRVMEIEDGELRQAGAIGHSALATSPTAVASSATTEVVLAAWSDVVVSVAGQVSIYPWSLELHAGEMVAFIAPSGAGKTSALRALSGDAVNSQVSVTGSGLRGAEVKPQHTQLMVQDSSQALNPGRSLLASCARQARVVLGIPRHEARVAAQEVLAELGIDAAVSTRRPGSCSGGERQRAALARALVCQPRILLLDEPTSALDPVARAKVLDALRRRARAGAGILIATHQAENITAVDRLLAPDIADLS